MALYAPPGTVAVDADIMIQLSGIPSRVVIWSLSGSTGTLTVLNDVTDDFGRASAIFTPAPGEEGVTATIQVEYGD